MRDDRFRNPWPLVGVLAAAAAMLVVGLMVRSAPAPAQPGPAAPRVESAEAPKKRRGPVRLPLERVEKLVVLGRYEACVLGGRHAACTTDEGETWEAFGPFPAPALSAMSTGKGQVLFACLDGSLVEAGPGLEPLLRASLRGDFTLADAAQVDGRLLLLAHRYDEPADPLLELPTIVETAAFQVGNDFSVRRLADFAGFAGDRILSQGDETFITYASVDQRAWRSDEGGSSFRRLPEERRFGQGVDGVLLSVERQTEKLPKRQARAASALWVSWDDGDRWERTFETEGELLVEFADRRLGLAISRGEGIAWVTQDGGQRFDPLLHDPSLDRAVDLGWLGGRFLAVTKEGLALDLHP